MKTEDSIIAAYKPTEVQVSQAWENVAASGLDYTSDAPEVLEMFESSIEALTNVPKQNASQNLPKALQFQVVGPGEDPKPDEWVTVGYLVPSKAPIWECAAVRRRQQTADAAGFLWRNGHGMWNASSPAHLQGYLRGSSVGRIIDDAEDVQLTIATATADKIQSVLVGYVARPCHPHAPRCPCKVCTP